MDPTDLGLPFVTRDMLRFKQKTTYELQIIPQGTATAFLYITGITRSGTFTYKASVTNNGQPFLQKFKLDDFPIFVSIVDKDYSFGRNGAYVQLQLLINGDIGQELCRGYVGDYESLTWPQTTTNPKLGMLYGQASQLTVSDPAAGAEISLNRNDYFLYKFRCLTATLVTSAAVANRFVHLKIVGGGSSGEWEVASNIAQVASKTYRYFFMSGLGTACYQQDNSIYVPVPNEVFMDGSTGISTLTTALDGADDWGAPKLVVEKFIG
jgi:hypothetical protein